ncbi:hypothetical protein BCR34DRAFT_594348 [Clohesyomyces aquaticus]|uniref:Uncharacterized protein n=1 Tax=Clohesyomyces aquaticus TaxID=1231657 RepID=A0A1Y1YAS1_9PLEO|nr:hypothetical protein BCR34DRAFT_594348 [Clohesyomyces aquaticus]
MKSLTPISFTLLLFTATGVTALPNVTSIQLKSDSCAYWPYWQNTRDADVTGTLTFMISDAEDPFLNGLFLQPQPYTYNGTAIEVLGADLRKSIRTTGAKTAYQCADAEPREYGGPTRAPAFRILPFGGMSNSGLGELKVEPYRHDVDGKGVDGVFLGSGNLTTWGFRYVKPSECGRLDYYEARLLGLHDDWYYAPPSGGEIIPGFLKVVTWPLI